MIDFNNIVLIKGNDGSVTATLSISARFEQVEDPNAEIFKSFARSMIWLKLYQEKKSNITKPVLEAVVNCSDRKIGQQLLEVFRKEFEMAT